MVTYIMEQLGIFKEVFRTADIRKVSASMETLCPLMAISGHIGWMRFTSALPPKADIREGATKRLLMVESGCGAVAVGSAYLFPPLSSGGASLAEP